MASKKIEEDVIEEEFDDVDVDDNASEDEEADFDGMNVFGVRSAARYVGMKYVSIWKHITGENLPKIEPDGYLNSRAAYFTRETLDAFKEGLYKQEGELTIEEVAQFTGWSQNHLRYLIYDKRELQSVRHARIPQARRPKAVYRREDVEKLVEKREAEAQED